MNFDLTYRPYGSHAILIEWPKVITETILDDIIRFKYAIEAENKSHIEDLINGYNSLTIKYSEELKETETKIEELKSTYLKSNLKEKTKSVTWQIPVCYNENFGIDLLAVSKEKGITTEQLVALHSSTVYTVYFIGFLPGFLYLGDLDEKLYIDRKRTPRLNIKKGSVGIGGKQTGIYPRNSAGGWNIIGRTPVSFFDVSNANPCFAKVGDKIQFVPVKENIYLQIEKEIEKDKYKLKSILDA